jgi:phage shock protein B
LSITTRRAKMSEAIPILLITVCLPLWIIFHYITKMKTSKGLSPEDEKMLSEVWESANKMQERINTLERILDIESPDWRRRS